MDVEIKGKITKFFPYESVFIEDRLLKIDNKETYNLFRKEVDHQLGNHMEKITSEEMGFVNYAHVQWDNKITFEVEGRNGNIFYIQFYDGSVHIALSVVKRNYEPTTHYYKINHK